MTWQILILIFLLLSTASYLIRRSLARKLPQYNRLINGFYYLCVLYPLGLFVAWFSSPNLHIGLANFSLLLVGSVIFPLINLSAYKASKSVDAGLFTILSNLTPIITIAAATLLLNEALNGMQMVGAAIIIASAFIATLPKLKYHRKISGMGLLLAIASVSLLGLAIVYERWMLTRIDYGAYLIFGWGAQTFWMTLMALPEKNRIKGLWRNQHKKWVLAYSLVNALKGLCFVSVLKLSGNASLVGAFISFQAVLVVLSAYILLKERQFLILKLSAAFIGALGLIILNLSF